MKPTHVVQSAPAIEDEFGDADFGDVRLSARLVRLAESCARAPDESLPRATGSKHELEAAYRFLGNEQVTLQTIVQPHIEQTARRAADAKLALVLHDTTEFSFSTPRAGLGRLRSAGNGFFMHASLVVAADGSRRPLGLGAVMTWTRHGKSVRYSKVPRRPSQKESHRWLKQIQASENAVGNDASLIHVGDREGDAYPLLAALVTSETRFVIRCANDRIARSDDDLLVEKVRTIAARADDFFELEVPLSSRHIAHKAFERKTHPPRGARIATLVVSATSLEIKNTSLPKRGPAWLSLNVVRVREVDAPDGVAPIEWLLFTTEPIESHRDLAAIVEYYRTRWLIGASSKGRITQSVEVRPRPTDSRSRSVGGTVARNQDGEALRQSLERRFAKFQVAA